MEWGVGTGEMIQNHPIERRKKVIEGLRAQGDPMSASVADWMEQLIRNKEAE